MSENKVVGNGSGQGWIVSSDKSRAPIYNHRSTMMCDGGLWAGVGRLAGTSNLPARFLAGELIVDKVDFDKEVKKEQSLHILRALVD